VSCVLPEARARHGSTLAPITLEVDRGGGLRTWDEDAHGDELLLDPGPARKTRAYIMISRPETDPVRSNFSRSRVCEAQAAGLSAACAGGLRHERTVT
jgi:hypothetical protein